MSAAENSVVGLAKQTAYDTENSTDADFRYLLFRDGAFGPNNITITLPPEVGGGAMQRGVVKVGVNSGGNLNLIPRPASLGEFLMGLCGVDTYTADTPSSGWNEHVFGLSSSDEFSAPYYTWRHSPGGLWGEKFINGRVVALTLDWAGANFLTGTLGVLGGLPTTQVSMAAWAPATYLDDGPQFLAPVSDIELPTSTDLKVLTGSFIATNLIPLDEQYIVGSYVPDGLDIVHRTFALTMAVKIANATLYDQMMYDPASGSAWVAQMYREADFKFDFISDSATYKLTIAANGQTEASGEANVYWSAAPIPLRAQRQVVMQVTGVFTATTHANGPINITLINQETQY